MFTVTHAADTPLITFQLISYPYYCMIAFKILPCLLGSVTSTDREKSSFQLPITAALASVGLVFTVIICILIAVIIMLLRSRSTTRTELKRLQANANVVYDVITAPPAPSIIEAKTNVAYDSVT